MADTGNENNTATESPATSATGDNANALLRARLCESEARDAIRAAGGDVELLLPHVRDAMRMEDDGEGVSITCTLGDKTVSLAEYIGALGQRENFAKAFNTDTASPAGDDSGNDGGNDSGNETATESVRGSGASEQGTPATGKIDPGNPLAIGHALEDIATGKVSVAL